MDFLLKKDVKALLKKYSLEPSKRLGQNFLIDKNILKKIIKAADLKPNDIVLEIGPGLGVLTFELAKKTKKVIAVEKDPKISEVLKKNLKNYSNIDIVQGDILKISNFKFLFPEQTQNSKFKTKKNYKVVANLPYYITSPLIRKFLEAKNQPKETVLMVQKEVAQRICAQPPKMNLLAVSVQFFAEPKIISYVSKKSFWPRPKVDSAILKIIPHKKSLKKNINFQKRFFKIVKAGFSQPRKQLLNNLSKELKLTKEEVKAWLLENKLNSKQRAETLNLKDWINLAKKYSAFDY